MPVTARLSKAFYERLGEDIANELVDWFNLVDATYRSDLREINELNYQRFDAKLEQRLAQFEAKVEQRLAQFEAKVEQRLAQFEAKVEQRLAKVEQRLAQLEHSMTQFDGRMQMRLEQGLNTLRTELLSEMNRRFETTHRLILLSWVTLLGTILALGLR